MDAALTIGLYLLPSILVVSGLWLAEKRAARRRPTCEWISYHALGRRPPTVPQLGYLKHALGDLTYVMPMFHRSEMGGHRINFTVNRQG